MDRLEDYRSAYDEDGADLDRAWRVSPGEEGTLTALGFVALAVLLWLGFNHRLVLTWLGAGGPLPILVVLAVLGLALLAFFGVVNGFRRLFWRTGTVDLGWGGAFAKWQPDEEQDFMGPEPEDLAALLGLGLPGGAEDAGPEQVVVYDAARGIGTGPGELEQLDDG